MATTERVETYVASTECHGWNCVQSVGPVRMSALFVQLPSPRGKQEINDPMFVKITQSFRFHFLKVRMPNGRRVCGKHRFHDKSMNETEVSACENCSGFLASSSYLLCRSCSRSLNVCALCGIPVIDKVKIDDVKKSSEKHLSN